MVGEVVVFIGGGSGVGKTSVAIEVHAQLTAAEVSHCVIDGDFLDMAHPAPWEHGLTERNLSAMWSNYRALGYSRMVYTNTVSVLPGVMESLVEAMGGDVEAIAVLLTCTIETAHQRLRQRERGSELDRHVRRADSVDEARQWITDWRAGWSEETQLNWALVDRSTDSLMGRVSLKGVDLHDGSAGVAYWMVPAWRGRGLCSQAVIALCQWAFKEARFHRIGLEHSVSNLASYRVAVKAGFHAEGFRRDAALHADGWHDMHQHALFAGPADVVTKVV